MPFPALGQELGHTVPNMWFYSDLHVVLRPETISLKELLGFTKQPEIHIKAFILCLIFLYCRPDQPEPKRYRCLSHATQPELHNHCGIEAG